MSSKKKKKCHAKNTRDTKQGLDPSADGKEQRGYGPVVFYLGNGQSKENKQGLWA